MPRRRPPSPAADPRLDLDRVALEEAAVMTPRALKAEYERIQRNDPATPRDPAVVAGSRSDGTALLGLLRALEDLGFVIDETEA